MKKRNCCLFFVVLALITICAVGCKKEKAADNEPVGGFSVTEDVSEKISTFSITDYEKQLSNERKNLSDCQQNYPADTKALTGKDFSKIHFQNCEFEDFPDTKDMSVMVGKAHGITAQESWDTIENWLRSQKKLDKVDMKKKVNIATDELPDNKDGSYPLMYPNLSKLKSGSGAGLNLKSCAIEILENGIYCLSDGKISKYLKADGTAESDAFGTNCGPEVVSGSLEALKDKSYPLISGKLSIGEGQNWSRTILKRGHLSRVKKE